MGRDIRLAEGVGERIATRHDEASTAIADTVEGMPSGTDGGLASTLLAQIMGGVSGTAANLADINSATAVVVRDTEGKFGSTDAEVGSTLRDMTEGLEVS